MPVSLTLFSPDEANSLIPFLDPRLSHLAARKRELDQVQNELEMMRLLSETDSPGLNAAPGSPDLDYSQSSWNVRLGMDRFAHISPDFHLYVGPGIQYWSGKAEFEDDTASVESESANRIALSGRLGAIVGLGGSVSLNGHLGGYIGRASAEDEGAEASWTPSGHDGAVGIAFVF